MNFIHLDNWVSRINAGQFDELVSMYSENAVLFATFDKQPLITLDLIQGYFRGFLAREASGVELDNSSICHSELGNGTYVSTGLYTFFYKEDGQSVRHDARFTFIFDTDSQNPIVHHHSSVIPG